MKSEDELIADVKKIISETLKVKVNEINDNSDLIDDLGADSIDIASIVMLVEDEFGIMIQGDLDYQSLRKFGDIKALIKAEIVKKQV